MIAEIDPNKQYEGHLTIEVIEAFQDSHFQKGKPLYIAFNVGGKSNADNSGSPLGSNVYYNAR